MKSSPDSVVLKMLKREEIELTGDVIKQKLWEDSKGELKTKDSHVFLEKVFRTFVTGERSLKQLVRFLAGVGRKGT